MIVALGLGAAVLAVQMKLPPKLFDVEGFFEGYRVDHLARAKGLRRGPHVTALWQSSARQHRKPTPVNEVRHAIHALETVLVHAVGHGKHERGFCQVR